ncbi:unnamed protein product [Symbiodinium microadriaticum]|nr:unnamed protein product [Symbiodinium microadriaticum]
MLRNLDGWVPRGRNIAEETWCTVAFSGCQPNVCPFDYLQCGADDGFGMLLELLQETEKASIIRTAAYLRNLQQAAQADSLSNVMGSKTSTNHEGRLLQHLWALEHRLLAEGLT